MSNAIQETVSAGPRDCRPCPTSGLCYNGAVEKQGGRHDQQEGNAGSHNLLSEASLCRGKGDGCTSKPVGVELYCNCFASGARYAPFAEYSSPIALSAGFCNSAKDILCDVVNNPHIFWAFGYCTVSTPINYGALLVNPVQRVKWFPSAGRGFVPSGPDIAPTFLGDLYFGRFLSSCFATKGETHERY